MPSGKTHEKVNILFFIVVNLICLFIGFRMSLISLLFTLGYFFGTYFLGPDLDTKSRPFYRWKMLRFIWIPYRKTFHHRSFWTHSMIISDIIRIGYLCVLYLIAVYGVAILWNGFLSVIHATVSFDILFLHHLLTEWISTHTSLFFSFIVGIMLASIAHIVADYTVSNWKKNKRKKQRK